jgi:exopolysaccharide biosynthesis polyprenyl glycosylphosphotransferase
LIPAICDALLFVTVFAVESRFIPRVRGTAFNVSVLITFEIAFLLFAIGENVYSMHQRVAAETSAALRAILWATLIGLLACAPAKRLALPLLGFGACNGCALLISRSLWHALNPAQERRRNVLIVGSGATAQRCAEAIRRDARSERLVKGFIADSHLRNVYGPAMLSRIAREEFIDEVIVASGDPAVVRIAISESRRNFLDVSAFPEIGAPRLSGRVTFTTIGGLPLLNIQGHEPPEFALNTKRALDVGTSLLALVILAPLALVIAGLIKLDSPGPALYRADRTGRKGRRFRCYKFRTMICDADALKSDLRAQNEREGAFFKMTNDPRITRMGRVLRRYSLDELPQLWNVLRGDMSLVGPRPHPPDDVKRYQLRHLQRLDFVPGLTGLWQVTARGDPSFERSVALDVEYISRWNLWLDLRILLRTVAVVFAGSGV